MEEFKTTPYSHKSEDSLNDTCTKSNMSTTFRDTEIEEDTANNLLKIQSLTSIVNDPKADSILR